MRSNTTDEPEIKKCSMLVYKPVIGVLLYNPTCASPLLSLEVHFLQCQENLWVPPREDGEPWNGSISLLCLDYYSSPPSPFLASADLHLNRYYMFINKLFQFIHTANPEHDAHEKTGSIHLPFGPSSGNMCLDSNLFIWNMSVESHPSKTFNASSQIIFLLLSGSCRFFSRM